MEIHVLAQGKDEEPVLKPPRKLVIDFTEVESMTFVVIESGMKSGEPSVVIIAEDQTEVVFLQTSLDKLIAGTSGCASMAETRWGWVRPEGHATLMPPDPETRKKLLEAIKKELEEWE